MPSFDIVSQVNLQEIDNAVNQAVKEISQRFDFRGTESKIEFNRGEKNITIWANSEKKIDDVVGVLYAKATKRQVDLKAFNRGKVVHMSGFTHKCVVELVQGVEKEKAKKIVQFIKDMKAKVQAAIHDDKVRVTGKKRDDLQEVISAVKGQGFDLPLQFDNFRD